MSTVQEVAAASVQARRRIRQHIYQTPLIPARKTGLDHGSKVLFKAENFQLTGSFKLRGAMSKLSALPSSGGGKLITASSGNHGIGASLAAQTLAKDLTVVLPETVLPAKLDKIRAYGAQVLFHGAETGLAEQHAQQLAASGAYTYVSPYNDPDIVAGQGTIALELLEQCDRQVDNIFISLGGGGLVSGIGSVLKAFCPQTRIYGVAAANSKALAASVAAGRVVQTEHLPTLAEAVSGGMDEDTITLPLASAVIDHVVECTEEEIAASMRALALDENMLVEGAAALALAGFAQVAKDLAGQTSVVLLCGANFDPEAMRNILYSA